MSELWSVLGDYLYSLKDNEFFKGTLPAALIAYLGIWGRKIPSHLLWGYRRWFRLSVEFHELEQNYDKIKLFINNKFDKTQTGNFLNSKEVGNLPMNLRFFWYRGKLCSTFIRVKNHDNKNVGVSSISVIIVLNFYGFRNNTSLKNMLIDAEKLATHKPKKYIGYNGSRYKIGDINVRKLSTVYSEHKEDIVGELKEFYSSEEDYKKTGIPYKICFGFVGDPGTGKTSMAYALAYHFQCNVVSVNIATCEDKDLEFLFLHHPGGSDQRYIYLIEDLDCVLNTDREKTNNEDDNPVSLNTLLNVLDGALTPHGCVFIITSNYPERLDKALMRAGRMDHIYEFSSINQNSANEMCNTILGRNLNDHEIEMVESEQMSAAELQRNLWELR